VRAQAATTVSASEPSSSLYARFERAVEQYCPDPLVFAILLTLLMLALAFGLTDTSPAAAISAWGNGLHSLLAFTMQMCLIIITAYVLAHTRAVNALLRGLGRLPRNALQAYSLVTVCSALLSLLCWPLGPIGGGIIAREVALDAQRRGIAVNYPLLAAAAFGGFVVWEMGYSSSIGLAVATPGNPLETMVGGTIPVADTLLAWWNLLTIVTTIATVLLTVFFFHYKHRGRTSAALPHRPDQALAVEARTGLVGRMENGRALSTMLALLLFMFLGYWFATRGLDLSLNIVNWTFLALGLLLANSSLHYADLFANGARVASPVLLQYPLYGGMMGLALQSGLAEQFTDLIIRTASAESLPLIGFLSAGFINIFIPSGGAQWAIQGPTFIAAAQALDVDLAVVTMSIAWGDQWTNLIQPFCAVPLLAVTGLRLREIYSYCIVICLVSALPMMLGLYLA
jgi:short-chain fatty acids transporter